jgi:tRNA nucleotidyltransferase (CCA-adding enzyme)
MKIYQVGGSIRDKLLGLPISDRDWLVVGSTPDEMFSLGYKAIGSDFPVFLHPDTHEEYALARTERKTSPGYKGFSFHAAEDVTLEQDLLRRDLTINAIAEDENGKLIDPHSGKADLDNKILRHVSPAFVEDPLRVLRIARFAARFNFAIAPETMEIMKDISESGELAALVPERIWAELDKTFGYSYASRFFNVLRECNALKQVFPEIDSLFGVPQPENHHPEIDTGVHTMMVLDQAIKLSEEKTVRFAALVHDLGKATTPKDILPKHKGHEERGVKIVKAFCSRLKIPNRYRDLAIIVCRYHLICHTINELRAETVVKKLEAMDAFRRPDRFDQFLIACEADAKGRTGFTDREYPQANQFRKYFETAQNINMQTVITNEMDGPEIAKAVHQLRINAIIESTQSISG